MYKYGYFVHQSNVVMKKLNGQLTSPLNSKPIEKRRNITIENERNRLSNADEEEFPTSPVESFSPTNEETKQPTTPVKLEFFISSIMTQSFIDSNGISIEKLKENSTNESFVDFSEVSEFNSEDSFFVFDNTVIMNNFEDEKFFLAQILEDKKKTKIWKKYLAETFVLEHFNFYEKYKIYKNEENFEKKQKIGDEIFDEFINPKGKTPIGISHLLVKKIKKLHENGSERAFHQVLQQVIFQKKEFNFFFRQYLLYHQVIKNTKDLVMKIKIINLLKKKKMFPN